jgi:hypothetical protein
MLQTNRSASNTRCSLAPGLIRSAFLPHHEHNPPSRSPLPPPPPPTNTLAQKAPAKTSNARPAFLSSRALEPRLVNSGEPDLVVREIPCDLRDALELEALGRATHSHHCMKGSSQAHHHMKEGRGAWGPPRRGHCHRLMGGEGALFLGRQVPGPTHPRTGPRAGSRSNDGSGWELARHPGFFLASFFLFLSFLLETNSF